MEEKMDENEHFQIEEVILNLKLIGKIKQNEKMIVINKILSIDNRVAQPLRRWYTSDNRYNTIEFIGSIINKGFDLMQQTNDLVYNKEQIKKEILATIQGLENLSATYKIDILMISKIDILKEKIIRICKIENE